jgi:uncharacterized protein YecE (DUF72 family)
VNAQQELFAVAPRAVAAAPPKPELIALGGRLSPLLQLGTMSWSFPGWAGTVYGEGVQERLLASHGLAAYAQHPLLRAVEIDRTFYEPLPAEAFAGFAAQVPDRFRFLVKAHQACTIDRYPAHARYGSQRGEDNPLFLDAAYANEAVVAPLAGLGSKLSALIFQFPPQLGVSPDTFPNRLHRFLSALPKGPTYAVELRVSELLTPAYGAVLADVGALHVHNVWTAMPSVLDQARTLPAATRRPLIVRWLMRAGDVYASALDRYAPFNRVVDEDASSRSAIAQLVKKALGHAVPAFVTVNNKAEGCAPESIVRLAGELAG